MSKFYGVAAKCFCDLLKVVSLIQRFNDMLRQDWDSHAKSDDGVSFLVRQPDKWRRHYSWAGGVCQGERQNPCFKTNTQGVHQNIWFSCSTKHNTVKPCIKWRQPRIVGCLLQIVCRCIAGCLQVICNHQSLSQLQRFYTVLTQFLRLKTLTQLTNGQTDQRMDQWTDILGG